jgi:MFS family permease
VAEVLAGARHIVRTVVLRQMLVAGGLTLAVLGFSETLVFAIVGDGLHRAPSFVGVLMAAQGVGAVAGAACAARIARRAGERVLAGLGMALVAAGALLMISAALPVVLAGVVLFGAGMPWIVVGAITLLQRVTPAELQGRAYSAADLLLGAPQTASIAAGAALVAVVGYRWLLAAEAAVVALAATYLLSRRSGEQALRGARELEDDGGLRLGRRGRGLGLGDDGAHAVE